MCGFFKKGDVFGYHHYHSNCHEVLGIMYGSATLHIGGDSGQEVKVHAGDVIVLPAGTGHKRLNASADFQVVGAYPGGMSYDLKTGRPDERPHALCDIQKVPFPDLDPVYGTHGPLVDEWKMDGG
ncbi:cupin domain-containing protein [Paenibacillus thalictri]|uniref:Cupin domain-containing protein n=1 Tax=Paenibacillus thalictri TaxID=2527873 RepID=A0A4Q9DLQ3_9BACL|nr:cupin domain-containing protein [Paenibacillus thalictri]TBL74675.1 cupin domain-containing protein [Paenibacillus thalictri]